jgi:hypothetical protein
MKAIALSAYVRGLVFLDDVAAWTGGLSLRVSPSKDPALAAQRISMALRNRYVIGYRMPDTGEPQKWHTIRVKVRQPRVNVYARSGYREP